ncbi:MAG: alpha-hydroxy-acid oxidizing protein [Acidimicrobiaceae bacterium]|nr:alpha-hydroxy-acid oxidizing protein [Acidimicrobiaceae bacterium]
MSPGSTSSDDPGYNSLDDLERMAQGRLDAGTWAYLSDVAEDGRTAARERRVLDGITLRQRGLGETAPVDTSVSLFGQRLGCPVLGAPTSGQAFVHPDAEVAMARGCAAAGSLAVIPMTGSTTIEDIARAGVGWWLQLYLPSDLWAASAIVERAHASGAGAVVISIDVPALARRRNVPAGYPPGWHERLIHLRADAEKDSLFTLGSAPFRWSSLETVRQRSRLPVLVKGVLDPDDARKAVDHGADGVILSTHGGRQLDCAPTAAEVLPAVRDVVDGRAVLLADGGIRRGSHALRMMVRGADAVLVGRPALWGLACGGEDGVRAAFAILHRELRTAMALTGCTSVADISAEMEWPGNERQ